MTENFFQISDSTKLFHWEIALLLLSLDRVTPFWEEIGLQFSSTEKIKDAIRSFIVAQQSLSNADNDDINTYTNLVSSLINALFENIEEIEGKEGKLLLQKWIENKYIVCANEEPWHSVWKSLLFRLAQSNGLVLTRHGFSQEKLLNLIEFAKRWTQDWEDIEKRIELAEMQSLEGWDLEQYRYYQRETPDISPLDFLSSFLKCCKFNQIWEKIIKLLNPDEMELLNYWGQVEALASTSIPPGIADIPAKYRGQS